MSGSSDVSRDEWLKEMEAKCPSQQAFAAYVKIEQFVVSQTPLTCTYRRNKRGKSNFATFCGSAEGHCSVIQMYDGQCILNWKWKTGVPGLSEDQNQSINESFTRLRKGLDGSPTKGWEKIMVLKLGIQRVQEALRQVSAELVDILGTAKTVRQTKRDDN